MQHAVLLHGTQGSDVDYFWFGHLRDHLAGHGFDVMWPLLPHTEHPVVEETVDFLHGTLPSLDSSSVVVAHSSGCPLLLSFLERHPTAVGLVVLVAGFYIPVRDREVSRTVIQPTYDWERIRAGLGKVLLINADNDPWGCDDVQARPVAAALGGLLLTVPGYGHMGSSKYGQPMREFPLLEGIIDALLAVSGSSLQAAVQAPASSVG